MLLPLGKRTIRVRTDPALLVGMAAVLAGCASLTYYSQSVTGHLRLMAAREPIEEVLAARETDPTVKRKLAIVKSARAFASAELGLPENRSYAYYAQLDRPYAVWNVVATPRFSLQPEHWCFPVAGCVSYRGYFERADAEEKARELKRKGMDTAVLGATAYSTLGWFADPVISPMLDNPPPALAGLIFHELAHQQLYVSGDTAFNEAFASVVEEAGVARWVRARGRPEWAAQWRSLKARRARYTDLMLDARKGLEELYAGNKDDTEMARRKAAILATLTKRYAAMTPPDRRRGRLPDDINNAHLALVGAYHAGAPAFRNLLDCVDGDLPAFYEAVKAIGNWTAERRRAWLDGEVAAPACERPDRTG